MLAGPAPCLTDAQWSDIEDSGEFTDFTVVDVGHIEHALVLAHDILDHHLGQRPGRSPSPFDGIAVRDSCDDNNWTFQVTVAVIPGVTLVSEHIKTSPYIELGTGPHAARQVLEELLSEVGFVRARLGDAL